MAKTSETERDWIVVPSASQRNVPSISSSCSHIGSHFLTTGRSCHEFPHASTSQSLTPNSNPDSTSAMLVESL